MLQFLEILCAIIVGITIVIYIYQWRQYNALKPIKGPRMYPIIGSLLEFRRTPEEMYLDISRLVKQHGKIFQVWLGPFAQYIAIKDHEIVKKIMNSSKHIDKNDMYEYLQWLGDGLITSTGEKWRKRRKMLTTAFHFTILEQSVENFNNASNVLITKLKEHVNGDAFDIYPYITLCGLDVICETAMGIQVNAQIHSDSEYVCAVRNVCNISFQRAFSILNQSNFFFNHFSSEGRVYHKSLKVLSDMCDSVIKEKRKILLDEMTAKKSTEYTEGKKPIAFLDALLTSTIDGKPLMDDEIREEVATFMFAGHDTVSSGLSFTLYLLANHPEIQENVFKEIREILGDDKSRIPSLTELNSMRYLEAVIKESLRLYPPVPVIGRQLGEDLEIDNITIPKHSSVAILIHWMQRQEELFPNPDAFEPERFLNGSVDTNYYSHIPFSAGPRNCIGQKFAMYEMKLTIAKILRNYELLSAGPDHVLKLSVAIVFKSTNGIVIKLKARKYS